MSGLRSGSYGSVNGNGGGVVRKQQQQPAVLLHRISRIARRRKAGMMLLVAVASATVFCSLVAIVRDEDVSISILSNGDIFIPLRNPKPVMIPRDQNSATIGNEIKISIPVQPKDLNFTNHPCQSFSFPPPPPADGKRTGPRPCPVCYVSVQQAIAVMPQVQSPSPVLKNLSYVSEYSLHANGSIGGSVFGGHPSLKERSQSFDIQESMIVHCGFVRGKRPGQGTGFDIDVADLLEMERCHGLVVASAIFGNYDIIQQPKNISELSKRDGCFYMFVDEKTEAFVKNSSSLYKDNKVGIWRVVVVQNLPYADARRNGKIPKLLLHRLFPSARFSLWIDAKLGLMVDPYLLLERFLWRKNATFAISRHYRRFDVFEEAEANKAAGKYDNVSIDLQIEFYRSEGLTHYSAAKLPIISDVPEGCVIIREHIPITNLFTCLWFNEVDRFTSRDQISFSTVRDRIRAKVGWLPEMFLDCERRNFVVQTYHRELLERTIAMGNQKDIEPSRKLKPGTAQSGIRKAPPSKKLPVKRRKQKKSSSSRRQQPRAIAARDTILQ